VDTDFIADHIDELLLASSSKETDAEMLALGATGLVLHRQASGNTEQGQLDPSSPWSNMNTWRMNAPGVSTVDVIKDGEHSIKVKPADSFTELCITVNITLIQSLQSRIAMEVKHQDGSFGVEVGDVTINTSGYLSGDDFNIICNEQRHSGTLIVDEDTMHMYFTSGHYYTMELPESKYAVAGGSDAAGGMVSPMPGKITMIMVEPGTHVKAGEPIMAMEAMKMEHVIKAPADGVVDKILYSIGEQVEEKQILVKFEDA